jgi:hypothetical protein
MRAYKRIGTVALATAALASVTTLGTTQVAHATAAPPTTNTIVAGGNYTGVLLNGITVAFECHAAAPGAVSTAIDACYLTTGGSAPALALPGDAVATASTRNVPFAPFRLCWSASATFLNATRKATSGCTLLPSTGSVPALAGTGFSTA